MHTTQTFLIILFTAVILTRCVKTESGNWELPRPAVSEYKTYSDGQVAVYKDDQLISSTDSGVRTLSVTLYWQLC